MHSTGELPRRLGLLDSAAVVETLLIAADVPVYFIWKRKG
jgi:hypothetical protein